MGIRHAAGGQAGRDVDRLNTCRVEGGRVVDELTGPFQLGGPGNPVRIGFGYYDPTLVRHFFFEGGYVGQPVPGSQAYLEVLPVDK